MIEADVLLERLVAVETSVIEMRPALQAMDEVRRDSMATRERLAALESSSANVRSEMAKAFESITRLATLVEGWIGETRDIVSLTRSTKSWALIGKYALAVLASSATAASATLAALQILGVIKL